MHTLHAATAGLVPPNNKNATHGEMQPFATRQQPQQQTST
jgi:hypothetical protein